jgi:MFS family permease
MNGIRRSLRLSERLAFGFVSAMLVLLLFSATAPSPMYIIYQQRWQFSPTMLTVIFGVYAVTVLACLLLFGALSDAVGRRPVLIVSLVIAIASMILFATAGGVPSLLVARAMQGIGVGMATGAVSAALIELAPRRAPQRGILMNAIGPGIGIAVGAVVAGVLVEYAPAPTVLTYIVLIIAFAVVVAALVIMPETSPRAGTGSIRPRRVSVPSGARRPFTVFSLVIVALWAIGGMYMALGPSLVAEILNTRNHAIGGLVVTTFAGVTVIVQLALGRRGVRDPITVGVFPLLAGLALLLLAMSLGSAAWFFAGSIVVGAGWGAMYSGAFRSLSALAEPTRRGELLAAVYVVAYLSMSLPVVAAGLATSHFGLHSTTTVFGCVVAGLALIAVGGIRWARRTGEPVASRAAAAAPQTPPEPCPSPCGTPPVEVTGDTRERVGVG